MFGNQARLALALSATVILSACAAQRVVPLHADATSRIKSTDMIIAMSQQEIVAEINPSNIAAAGGGGLLLALIDVAVDKNRADDAEKRIVPVRDALIDYEFPKQLRAALEQELGKLPWMNLQSTRTEASPDAAKIQDVVARSTANAVLVVAAKYSLSPDFSLVKVSAAVTAYPKTDDLVAVAKKVRPDIDPPLLYRNDFQVAKGGSGLFPNAEAAAKAWSDNNGKVARDALNKGAAELAKRIAADLETARTRAQTADAAALAPTAPAAR
jgi:hypothetical protein